MSLMLCREFAGWQRAPGTPSHPTPDFPDRAGHPLLAVSWWVAQQCQLKGTAGYGNASLGIAHSDWDAIFREMRRILCPPRESEGCRLCAVGWVLIGAKCYWISDGMNPWNKSREDCRDRGSALLVPWDQDELEFLNESLQKPTRHFWIGLSVPVAGMGWTWENGSDLDQDRFQLDFGNHPGTCGTLKGNAISPQTCDTRLQWICHKESVQI
nr:killer cell lectin-like receptor subfamily B member 1C [Taeniopygia guttata]